MGGEPTPAVTPLCRSTLAPFLVGAGPPGPIPATNCRVCWDHPPCRSRCSAAHPIGPIPATNCRMPRDHPPCRSRCSAAHPMESFLMGKALACARKHAPLLSCSFAASESWPRQWSCEARLLRVRPIPCQPARSRLCPSHGTGLPPPSRRWAAARLPAYPVRLRRFR